MPNALSFLKRHSLVIGLVLMFLYTWTIDLSNSGVLPFKVPFVVGLTVGCYGKIYAYEGATGQQGWGFHLGPRTIRTPSIGDLDGH